MPNFFLSLLCFLLLTTAALAEPQRSVDETLDTFHQAAANADLDTYLGLMTPDMVFLGTDGEERWQGEQFSAFVSANFSKGRGWTYNTTERHSVISPSGHVAWFDELLAHDKYGRCRGSGVLLKSASGWRIAQYNLSVPIPNDMLPAVVRDIIAADTGTTEK